METCYISSAEMLEVARYASLSPGTPEKRPMAITKHRIIAMPPVCSRLPDFQTHNAMPVPSKCWEDKHCRQDARSQRSSLTQGTCCSWPDN
jgi:hypothetical protein